MKTIKAVNYKLTALLLAIMIVFGISVNYIGFVYANADSEEVTPEDGGGETPNEPDTPGGENEYPDNPVGECTGEDSCVCGGCNSDSENPDGADEPDEKNSGYNGTDGSGEDDVNNPGETVTYALFDSEDGIPVYIGSDGKYYVYDEETGEYTETEYTPAPEPELPNGGGENYMPPVPPVNEVNAPDGEITAYIVFPGWNAGLPGTGNTRMGISQSSTQLLPINDYSTEWSKKIEPDPDNFREYIATLTFIPGSDTTTVYTSHTVAAKGENFGFTGGNENSFPFYIYVNNRFFPNNLAYQINYINGLLSAASANNTPINPALFKLNSGNSNIVVTIGPGGWDTNLTHYFRWRAFEVDENGNIISADPVIIDVQTDLNVASSTPSPGTLLTPNAFSPTVENMSRIGEIIKINNVSYMLIDMADITDNPENAPSGQINIIFKTNIITKTYDRIKINGVINPYPAGFEPVPDSISINNNFSETYNDFSGIQNEFFIHSDVPCTITYRIRPVNFGTEDDFYKDGAINIYGGDTALTTTVYDSAGNLRPDSPPVTGKAAITHDFDAPPLFYADLWIYAGNLREC